jgi:carboxymethylenebutenolidase
MKNPIMLLAILFLAPMVFAQATLKERLEKSPRHQEWLDIQSGNHTVHTFVVYPQKKDKTAAIILIHENKGLTDWVRTVADRIAEKGYIAIAPDFLSGKAPHGGNTEDFPDSDATTQAIYKLSPDEVTVDLHAVAETALKMPACNGKLAVTGFCWGGGQAFRFATEQKDLKAAFVFYGSFDYTRESLQKIACPVYGFYGGNDARIGATIPETERLMKELNKTFEPRTYENADHAFMRKGEDPDASAGNKKAHDEAWSRWLQLLSAL